ncbi:hypothetical protein [Lysobacter gummosus]|uniref:hypothetical protein n=1 Tax=Lysobacter gummosus TaxID=262324 RepID=UPI003641EB0D
MSVAARAAFISPGARNPRGPSLGAPRPLSRYPRSSNTASNKALINGRSRRTSRQHNA